MIIKIEEVKKLVSIAKYAEDNRVKKEIIVSIFGCTLNKIPNKASGKLKILKRGIRGTINSCFLISGG